VASSLIMSANLANDPAFQSRVQAAMMGAAITIAGEAVGAQNDSTYQMRHQLAVKVLNSPQSLLYQFAWAVASSLTISGDVGAPVSIASSTAVNPAVITTAAAHGLSTGDVVEVSGHLVNTAVNGTFAVTVLSTTTFSVPALGNGAGLATGQVAKQPSDVDINFTVGSYWNDIAGIGVTT
jgi:hypothetical protein